MLYELRVENLLLMERAELRLAPGLNILTGETGAGKTLLAHALDLLLGGKARSGIVRHGAAEAYVEGVFALPPELSAGNDERIPSDAQELVLARRVWPDGRTRAYVCGRAATLADLRELGGRLISFYGQHEHRKLMLAAAQLELLDAYCGPAQLELRTRARALHERVNGLRARARELRAVAGAREREHDLLAFELAEIESVDPSEDEERILAGERDRLRHQETLRRAAASGCAVISPDDGYADGVAALLARAATELEQAGAFDPALGQLAGRMHSLRYEVDDLGAELRSYLASIDGPEGRLEEVEERLALFARLARKHGGTIAEVLAYADRCRERRKELDGAEVSLDGTESELAEAEAELSAVAAELHAGRALAAPELGAAVRERLGELAMADAVFEVEMRPRSDGIGSRGADAVEFTIAPGAAIPAGPLRDVASGGELSRVMLALLSVAHAEATRGDLPGELLVFDEIDAGIGGHTARAVGEHLRDLAHGRQILCITHLPQVAALAARHFTISKDGSRTPARTTVSALDGDAVVGEIVRMLGADEGDRAARGHARELLRAA